MYHLDYETFSPLPLPKVGASKYASHPDATIICAAVSKGNSEPLLWVNPLYDPEGWLIDIGAKELVIEMAQSDEEIYAHNAGFESAVSRHLFDKTFGVPAPRLERWRCTAAMARKAGLPYHLAGLCEALKLEQQKDKSGKALIDWFSMPQKNGGRNFGPLEKVAAFGDYCKQDVRAEINVFETLKPFELRGDALETFLFDMRLNHRGVPVNVAALKSAKKIIDEVDSELAAEFVKLTGLNYTQRDRVLEWLQAKGYASDNMQAGTVAKELTSPRLEQKARVALEILSRLKYAAVKKVDTMLNCVEDDGRIRGALMYYGAGTGRWSSKLVQFQNLKKAPSKKAAKAAALCYELLCLGFGREEIETTLGNPIELIAYCIRHFIHEPS